MKPTRKLSSYVLLVGVMGLSIAGGVVAYQIYAATIKSQTTEEQSVAIKPLDGVINKTTVDSLGKRIIYTDTQMNSFLITVPTPATTEITTETPTVTTEVATGSATTQ